MATNHQVGGSSPSGHAIEVLLWNKLYRFKLSQSTICSAGRKIEAD